MSALASQPVCKVCRRAIAPGEIHAFGTLQKPLFYTHTGVCAETVRDGVRVVGRITRNVLQATKPTLFAQAVQVFETVQRVRSALKQQNGE